MSEWNPDDIPSELGGTNTDWLTADAGVPADPTSAMGADWTGGSLTQLLGGSAGTGQTLADLFSGGGAPDLGSLSTLFTNTGPGAIDTSIPLALAPLQAGGNMADGLSALGAFDDPWAVARARRPGVPWRRITRMVHAAVRYFGPQVALSIVNQLAAYLQGIGVATPSGQPVSGGEILFRVLRGRKGTRRGRGVTYRQLNTTRRTIRVLDRMHSMIRRPAARHASGGGFHHRRRKR